MSAARYRDLILRLLPRGFAWRREAEKNTYKLVAALAEELFRVDGRGMNMLDERDPRTTLELITDWERFFGLPGSCGELSPTLEGRRGDVLARLNSLGGQSKAYFRQVAANAGYEITIEEFAPFYAGDLAGQPVYGYEWAHVWLVRASGVEIVPFQVGIHGVGDPLREFSLDSLECLINELKPAHTRVVFAFEDNNFRAGDFAGERLVEFEV